MSVYTSSTWINMLSSAKRATEMYDMLSPLEWYIATLFPDDFEKIMNDVHKGEHTKNPIHAYAKALAREQLPISYRQALELARVYFTDNEIPVAVAKYTSLWKPKLTDRLRTELVGKDGRSKDVVDENIPLEKWAAYLVLMSDTIAQDIKRNSLFDRIGTLNGVAQLRKQQAILGSNIWVMIDKLPTPQAQSLVWEAMHDRVDLPHVQNEKELQTIINLNAIMQAGAREGKTSEIAKKIRNNISIYATDATPRVDDQEWSSKPRSVH